MKIQQTKSISFKNVLQSERILQKTIVKAAEVVEKELAGSGKNPSKKVLTHGNDFFIKAREAEKSGEIPIQGSIQSRTVEILEPIKEEHISSIPQDTKLIITELDNNPLEIKLAEFNNNSLEIKFDKEKIDQVGDVFNTFQNNIENLSREAEDLKRQNQDLWFVGFGTLLCATPIGVHFTKKSEKNKTPITEIKK